MKFAPSQILTKLICCKKRFRLNSLTILSIMFYAAKHYGLMPFHVRKINSKGAPLDLANGKPIMVFELCRLGICFTIIQLLFKLWAISESLVYIITSIMDLEIVPAVICTTGNYCSVFGILLMHTFVSFLLILALPFRLRETGAILNEAELLLMRYYSQRGKCYDVPWPTFYLLFFVGVAYIASIYCSHYNKNPVLFFLFMYVKLSSNVLVNIVVILSVVAEKSYDQINRQLRAFAVQFEQRNQLRTLEELMYFHWYVTDYVDHISHCFGVELCIVMMEIYAQLIIRMFVTSYVLFLRGIFPRPMDFQLVGIFDLISVTSNLSYLCYRCDRVVLKGTQTQIFLQDICIQNTLDTHSKEVVHLFMMRLNCRRILINGYGFFTINLAQLVKIVGVVLTYFVVLVQFQSDNAEENTNVPEHSTEMTCEWPCVQF